MINQAYELKALANLRNLSTAAMIAASEESFDASGMPNAPKLTMELLKERGYLPRGFRTEEGQYRYTITQGAGYGEFEVRAEPVNASSSLRHFMIDRDGIAYAERGRPATINSPAP